VGCIARTCTVHMDFIWLEEVSKSTEGRKEGRMGGRRGGAKVLIFIPAAASVASCRAVVGLPRALPANKVTTNHTGPSDSESLWPTAWTPSPHSHSNANYHSVRNLYMRLCGCLVARVGVPTVGFCASMMRRLHRWLLRCFFSFDGDWLFCSILA
jgi:hypothetical protein